MKRFPKAFINSAAIVLASAGILKLVAALEVTEALSVIDPLFQMPRRIVYLLAAVFELAIAGWLLLGAGRWKIELVGTVAAEFALYRAGLWLLGSNESCPCLGVLTKILPISQSASNWLGSFLVVYLGCGAFLAWLWSRYTHVPGPSHPKT